MKTLTLNPLPMILNTHNTGVSQASGVNIFRNSDPFYAENSAWRSFQDGMRMLYRYAGKSSADSSSIAKANLRLLHRTLLADPSYRDRLIAAESEIPVNGIPVITNLVAMQGLDADLISLPPGCKTQITPNGKHNRMYMVVYGKMIVSRAINSSDLNNQSAQHSPVKHKSWWGRNRNLSNEPIYKQDDIILFGLNDHREKTLTASQHHCVILKLSLPVDLRMISH
ncbi:MAG: hypothetical protein KAU29_06335 [Gammaproteobacteria bacterium]|nr:hypothetical protein [Gammaproteobacteria bacterium]